MVGRSPDRGISAVISEAAVASGSPLQSAPLELEPGGLEALQELVTALRTARGHAVLIVAAIESPLLQRRLEEELKFRLPGWKIRRWEVDGTRLDLLRHLVEASPGNVDGLSVSSLGKLSEAEWSDLLQYLNYRRELLTRLSRPLILWLPSRRLNDLMRQAPDFWAFRSHVFEFRPTRRWIEHTTIRTLESGLEFRDAGDLGDQIALHETLLADLRRVGTGETSLAAALEQRLGVLLQYVDRWDEALSYLVHTQALYRSLRDRLGEANVLKAIGDVQNFRKELDAAIQSYQAAQSLYRQVGDRLGEANVLKAQGDVLAFLDQRDEALARYEEALTLFRQVGDRLGEANVLQAQGDVLAFLDQRDEALARYEQALGLFRQVGARLGEANVLKAQGDVLAFLDQHDEALGQYQAALALYRRIGARQGEANCYLGLGRLALAQGQLADAHRWTEQAIALHAANQSRYDVALDSVTLGRIRAAQGDTDGAVAAFRQASTNYAEIGLISSAASALTSLGDILDEAGREEEALAAYAAAVEIQPEEAMWRRNYANTLIALSQLDEAEAQLDAAAALEPEAPYLALRRAELARAREDRAGAAEWAWEALRRRPDWDAAQAVLDWAQACRRR